jgi:hypothetical protein
MKKLDWHTLSRWSLPFLSMLFFVGVLIAADMAAADGAGGARSGGLQQLEGEVDTAVEFAKRMRGKILAFISVLFAAGAGLAGLSYLKSDGEGREKVLNVLKGIGAVYVLLMIVGTCVPLN